MPAAILLTSAMDHKIFATKKFAVLKHSRNLHN